MKNQNIGLLILRIGLGLLMIFHGVAKLKNGVGGIEEMLGGAGLPGFIAYGAYIGEIIAPILMIIGYRTKIASLLMIATMLIAIFLANADKISSLTPSGGLAIELPALFLTGALALVFTGGGKLALSTKNKWD